MVFPLAKDSLFNLCPSLSGFKLSQRVFPYPWNSWQCKGSKKSVYSGNWKASDFPSRAHQGDVVFCEDMLWEMTTFIYVSVDNTNLREKRGTHERAQSQVGRKGKEWKGVMAEQMAVGWSYKALESRFSLLRSVVQGSASSASLVSLGEVQYLRPFLRRTASDSTLTRSSHGSNLKVWGALFLRTTAREHDK